MPNKKLIDQAAKIPRTKHSDNGSNKIVYGTIANLNLAHLLFKFKM